MRPLNNKFMAEIIWNGNFPELIKPKVSEILGNFSWIFPAWLQRLTVHYKPDDPDSSAFTSVAHDYRFANITICGYWVNETPDAQIEQIIHELIHIHFSPLKNYAVETVETLCGGEDKKMFQIIKNELVSKNEQATQDFAYSIANKFKGENKNEAD